MSLSNDIPTKLRVPAQLALDAKSVVTTLSQLQTLGTNNNLAYTYYKGMPVICAENLGLYRWRPVNEGETGGTLPSNFTYPAGIVSEDGVVYSNIAYNFFKETTLTVENLTELIQINNVGEGVEIYKDSTIVGGTTQFNFRTVVQEDQGTGESFLRDIQQTTDELKVRVKTLVSDNLTITATDEEVRIETPLTTSIPALYVNDLYKPTYEDWFNTGGNVNPAFLYRGEGTLAKPFTNSRNYTTTVAFTDVPDSAIQNALDGHPTLSYVGAGTRLAPDRVGEKIIVQDNTTSYNFTGNFGYSRLYIEVGGNINHTDTGMLFDMDNALHFNALSDSITIDILDGYLLASVGGGLNNSGSNVATNNLSQSRSAILKGKGTLFFPNNDITKYVINSDITNSGNNNDGNTTFFIGCKLRADYQGILKIGGVSRVYNYGDMTSGVIGNPVDVNLKAFLLMGGQFRNFNTSIFKFSVARTDGFVFTPTGGFTPNLVGQSATIVSFDTITNLFNKTNNNTAYLTFVNSDSSVLFNVNNIFESTNLWSVTFNQNYFESGIIDNTKVDLTFGNLVSTSNKIGANIVEHLRRFNNRADAIANSVPLYSAYIKTNGVAYPTTTNWIRDIVLPL